MSKAPTRVPTPGEGQQFLGAAFAKKTQNKFKHHSALIYTVMGVTTVAFVGMTIAVVTLFSDQARFNNQTYKEEAAATAAEARELKEDVSLLRNEIKTLSDELNSIKK